MADDEDDITQDEVNDEGDAGNDGGAQDGGDANEATASDDANDRGSDGSGEDGSGEGGGDTSDGPASFMDAIQNASTANSEPRLYDFSQPTSLTSSAAHDLEKWLQRIQSLLSVKLEPHVPDLQCQVERHEVGAPDVVTPPQPMVAYRVSVNDQFETVLAFHRPLAATIVSEMLGEEVTELVEDRELTAGEQSLFDLITRDILELIDETGMPIGVRVSLLGPERRTQLIRLFPPGEPLLMLRFQIENANWQGEVAWIWPHRQAERTLSRDEPIVPSPHWPQISALLPFHLKVKLGQAQLSVHHLANLQPGDIIQLDQSVGEPLVGEIGGAKKLHVWPGRDGSRQAVQVETFIG